MKGILTCTTFVPLVHDLAVTLYIYTARNFHNSHVKVRCSWHTYYRLSQPYEPEKVALTVSVQC